MIDAIDHTPMHKPMSIYNNVTVATSPHNYTDRISNPNNSTTRKALINRSNTLPFSNLPLFHVGVKR